tara:strand:+ start:2062 stop:2520 length:459 start_codon:yes stop_codon:yes gene_type:complete
MDIKIKKYASAIFENELFLLEISLKKLTINYNEYLAMCHMDNKDGVSSDMIHSSLVNLQSVCIMQTKDRYINMSTLEKLKNTLVFRITIDLPYSGQATVECTLLTNPKYHSSEEDTLSNALKKFNEVEGRDPDIMKYFDEKSDFDEPEITIN